MQLWELYYIALLTISFNFFLQTHKKGNIFIDSQYLLYYTHEVTLNILERELCRVSQYNHGLSS